MTSTDPKFAKLQTHLQALATVSASLNASSDELTKNVSVIDEVLKRFNVGVPAWVTFRSRSVEDDQYDDDQIGYCKVEGRWGLALRRIWGDYSLENFNQSGPWLFNDAPRELRLLSADKISEVIEELGKAASDTAKKVQQKAREVGELAAAISKAVTQEQPTRGPLEPVNVRALIDRANASKNVAEGK
ncbi:MAG: hypothetical protein ABSH13_09275 [Candidatus Acidiferrum sp.]|jgi:hypothetical protein